MIERGGTRKGRGATQAQNAARAYRAALHRLVEGKATHPALAGRLVRITPAAVAREARRSRNPLYATHRDILDEIAIAVSGPNIGIDLTTTVAQLRDKIATLHAAVRRQADEKRRLASENLLLLYRARIAEERLQAITSHLTVQP
ncbi:hypothetical protein [Asaia bogorensis]|uniref:Uncharacterized protein n=1 Tax=Asaia bogorensis NBRC 16594 TaxID=1231624 RepID=A0AAN4R5G8_9PROT|nr:hypothetical protein [Asaia bogorensis]GBQ81695.1 hypothetical protein AA0311_2677 [Asaia bogorensis NBRC 16594]GEL54797.1 hypothetical protein ABO01nite_28040 [Asaia bogorensis NBRC 16594]